MSSPSDRARTAASVFEHVFTSANPTTGSLPPEPMAWVIYANGTVFHTQPTSAIPPDATVDALVAAGDAALDELGPVFAGSPAGDFNVLHLTSRALPAAAAATSMFATQVLLVRGFDGGEHRPVP